METILTVIGAFVLLLLALLAVPVTVEFVASVDLPTVPLQKRARLRWAFGLVEVSLGGRSGRPAPEKRAAAVAKRKRPPRRLKISKLLTNPAFWHRLALLLRRLVRATRWHLARLHARFGLDDPADTGRLWGMIGPLATVLLPSHPGVSIGPDFEASTLSLQGQGEVQLVPLRILGILVIFVLAPATWRILWPALKR